LYNCTLFAPLKSLPIENPALCVIQQKMTESAYDKIGEMKVTKGFKTLDFMGIAKYQLF